MIRIGNEEPVLETENWPPLWQKIVRAKKNSASVYRYASLAHLQFELKLRTAIVEAAKALRRSGVQFEDFEHSHCNERFWHLNNRGGFELRSDVTPAEGIRDIFANGPLYGFECATAIVIVLYKGLLDCIREKDFNRMFADLLLYDWHYDATCVSSKSKALPKRSLAMSSISKIRTSTRGKSNGREKIPSSWKKTFITGTASGSNRPARSSPS
ncbi:Protein-glutamine gamma-glutamyltransferase [Paenibacillus sp. P1XP2]|nr:Protein-glutamine gamma-glutamyltransferase [Paenibacillus sp. P1XP2]